MGLQATCAYFKTLLDGLAMPGGIPNLVAYIMPPAVDEEPNGEPRAYIWPASFEESRRSEREGTVPRAQAIPVPGVSPNSGFKPIDHSIHIYIIYDQDNADEQADSLFPGIIDAVGWTLRTSLDPATIYDVYTGLPSALMDVGETITGSVAVRALEGQRMYRLDCLLILPVFELIQS